MSQTDSVKEILQSTLHSLPESPLPTVAQGMEIGYKRVERLGLSQPEYGDQPAGPSDIGDGRFDIDPVYTLRLYTLSARCLHNRYRGPMLLVQVNRLVNQMPH